MKTFLALLLALGLSTVAAAQTPSAHRGDFFAWNYANSELLRGVDSFELCVSASQGKACVPVDRTAFYTPAGTAKDPAQPADVSSFRTVLPATLPYMTYTIGLRGCIGPDCSSYQTNFAFTLMPRCADTLVAGNPDYCNWLLRLFGLCPACSA